MTRSTDTITAKRSRPLARPTARWRVAGLSLIELIMFIVVVGIALAAVMSVFVQATNASADPQLRRQALAIAESLLEEIELQAFTYCDPDSPNASTAANAAACGAGQSEAFGPDSNTGVAESRYGTTLFDNVNDYNGFAMSGIRDITNAAVPGLAGFNVSVTVAPGGLGSIGITTGNAVVITVTVTGPNSTSVSLQGYRTRHAPNP